MSTVLTRELHACIQNANYIEYVDKAHIIQVNQIPKEITIENLVARVGADNTYQSLIWRINSATLNKTHFLAFTLHKSPSENKLFQNAMELIKKRERHQTLKGRESTWLLR